MDEEEIYIADDDGGIDWPVVTDVLDTLLPYYTSTLVLFGGEAPAPVVEAGAAAAPAPNYTGIIIWVLVGIAVLGGIIWAVKRNRK